MSENYIVINGKRAELTKEQLKQLGIETENKNPFARSELYYTINYNNKVSQVPDNNMSIDKDLFEVANYCTDKGIMEQRALHETLSRLLWRYSMEHTSKTKSEIQYYTIFKDKYGKPQARGYNCAVMNYGEIPFDTLEIAQSAIKDIVIPFMKKHPEFKW